MIPRKKRIAIIVTIITLISLLIIGIFAFLYLKTDSFRSNETLFVKYFIQNFSSLEFLNENENSTINNLLNTNKYTSQVTGNIKYTENIGTSDENTNSPINDVGIKINSNIDKINSYYYSNILIGTENEDLAGLEILNKDQTYGIRLNGIKQFVSAKNQEDDNVKEISNIKEFIDNINLSSILSFSQQEKQELENTYLEILRSNVTKDKYYKQKNAIITINNKDIQANSYCIKLTVEEYNNLLIKILEQTTKNEIILSKLDLIEENIKEAYPEYEQDETLRQEFINYIEEQIEEIKNNNIGNDEVKVTVYEKDRKLVRTSVEKVNNKITIDLYNNSYIKIGQIKTGDQTSEQFIKIEKTNSTTENNIEVEYENIQDNEILYNIKVNYLQNFENEKLNRNIEMEISNNKYESIITIENQIEFVQEFENEITLEEDNIFIDEIPEEQKNTIVNILYENIQKQIENILSKIKFEDYTNMFKNLGMIKQSSIQIPNETGVTDIERTRFNSQFEFFASEDLTTNNIQELINVVENNFDDMKVLLKNGTIEDLDIEKATSNNQEGSDYKKTISEILISIKENSTNEDKKEDIKNFLENNKNYNYDVSIEYDSNNLVRIIRIKLKED